MRKMLFVLGVIISIFANGQWSELGGINGLAANNGIAKICSDASGNIYAVGAFTNGTTLNNGKRYVAKYNGSSWSELGGTNALSANDDIIAIYSDTAGNIYAAGDFINSSGKYYVAKYNGTSWSELGGLNALSANYYISSICIDASGNIYAAGAFTNGTTLNNGKYYVAKYDGSTWSELGGTNSLSANGSITSICTDAAGNIYVAGYFKNSSGKYYVAKYDGTNWSELGGTNALSANNGIESISGDAVGNIYAVGLLKNVSGKYYVAKYDGSIWSELGGINALSANGYISSVCSDVAGNLYAVGVFRNPYLKCYVAKYDGSTWSELGGTNALAANNNINAVYSDAFGNIYTSGHFTNANNNIYVAKYAQPVPLKLLSFTAKLQTQKTVLLNWQTANEVNVSHINIQRSINGKDFTSIGKVNASCCSYEFTDGQLSTVNSQLYYRLEMVDKDGSKTYSQIQQINIQHQTSNIVIFPNPAKDLVTIECANAKELLIIDYLGRTVYRSTVDNQPLTVNTKQFSKGIYVLKAMMNNGDVKTEKLVVE